MVDDADATGVGELGRLPSPLRVRLASGSAASSAKCPRLWTLMVMAVIVPTLPVVGLGRECGMDESYE